MHFRAQLEITDHKSKIVKDRLIYVRGLDITSVFDVVHKIRGARWLAIDPIDLKTYLAGVEKQ